MLRLLPEAQYETTPWQNGRGTTSDIMRWPDGANRSNFDIRISIAPILEDAAFSLFAGVDRYITLLKGRALSLEFPQETVILEPLRPVLFDNGEPPFARISGGPAEVFNVSMRRGRWRGDVTVLRAPKAVTIEDADMVVLFAAEGHWLARQRSGEVTLACRSTGIVTQEDLMLEPHDTGALIVAHLSPLPSGLHPAIARERP